MAVTLFPAFLHFPCSQAAVSMLKQDYKEGEMTLSSALALAVKVLNKTMDVSKLSAEKGAPLGSRRMGFAPA